MSLWLFRRKSRRKRARSGTMSGDEAQRPIPRSQTEPATTSGTAPARQRSLKKQRMEPNKLSRRGTGYSFEAGRRDSIQVGQRKRGHHDEPVPPLPQLSGAIPAGSSTLGRDKERHSEEGGVMGKDVFPRVPTLHANKRDGQHLRQRKSSKRRKNSHDREREAELKAMSHFTPVRPAAETWTAGRPMKRDTRRVRTGLGIGFGSGSKGNWDREPPSSDISLPIPESIDSSMSSDSDQVAYKISSFDVLAPKPTLRYASHPRWGTQSGGSMPQGLPSQRRRLLEGEPIPEATLKAHKRIDDLADDLNASDLRELMERDKRRRERRRQKEQEKIDRRLARKAEKQKQAADRGAHNLERGVIGREVGLGIDPTSAVVTSSKIRTSDRSPKGGDGQSEDAGGEKPITEQRIAPLDAFHRTSSMPLEQQTPAQEVEEPAPPMLQVPKQRGFLRSKKSRSKSPPLSDQGKAEVSETPRKGSESSSSRGPMSWAAIFRWGNKNKRPSGPSSFSNTSRDSMGTQPQPAAPVASAAAFMPPRPIGSSVPRRTLSRFREDLPDFPMSPPESRMQSPEADPIPPAIEEQDSPPVGGAAGLIPGMQEQRYGTPTSDLHSYDDPDAVRRTPTSSVLHDEVKPSPEPHQSMSMASIGSEGSWLSGRLGNRSRSSQIQQRDSATQSRQSRHQHHLSGGSEDTTGTHQEGEEDDIADVAEDEYLSRYAHHSSSAWTKNRKSTGEARPSSDEEDDARLGAVGGRVPMVVPQSAVGRIKSREGLLNTGDDGDSEAGDLESPISPISIDTKEEEAGLQRATSVNLGKGHARHISAGSAKLLELSPRSSIDTKRRSVEPRPF